MNATTSLELQERQCAPLALLSSAEPLNATNLENAKDLGDGSKFQSHSGSGCNFRKEASMSGVFVVGVDGKPLTPTTSSKARKLMKRGVAKPIWNKFGQFGIKMQVETRKETPMTVLGVDFGTKFEGYSVVSEKENNLNVMWKLPDKKNIVRKMDERRQRRREKRKRNCRRRECRSLNRRKQGFIAPSQKVVVCSRLKSICELFKYYPIQKVALEDVKFNHTKKRYGANFTTIEIGKTTIYKLIKDRVGRTNLILFDGGETKQLRDKSGFKKTHVKSLEKFSSHCIDSFVIAKEVLETNVNPVYEILLTDDTYRPVRRKLHYVQTKKRGLRKRYSAGGNINGIRKGTICEYGQIIGGEDKKRKRIYYRDFSEARYKGKELSKVKWFSKKFKTRLCSR